MAGQYAQMAVFILWGESASHRLVLSASKIHITMLCLSDNFVTFNIRIGCKNICS